MGGVWVQILRSGARARVVLVFTLMYLEFARDLALYRVSLSFLFWINFLIPHISPFSSSLPQLDHSTQLSHATHDYLFELSHYHLFHPRLLLLVHHPS